MAIALGHRIMLGEHAVRRRVWACDLGQQCSSRSTTGYLLSMKQEGGGHIFKSQREREVQILLDAHHVVRLCTRSRKCLAGRGAAASAADARPQNRGPV